MVLLIGSSLPAIAANDKDAIGPVEVSSAVYSDVSPALRDLSGFNPAASTDKEKKEKPLRILPNMGNAVDQIDGALQTSPGPLAGTTGGLNFAGVGQGDYGFTDQYAPPDTNGAVGATQYVQWVNTYFAVFNKSTGAIATGFPKPGNSIWAGFGGGCQQNNDGDPIVQYDKLANRWILTQFSVSTTPRSAWPCPRRRMQPAPTTAMRSVTPTDSTIIPRWESGLTATTSATTCSPMGKPSPAARCVHSTGRRCSPVTRRPRSSASS